MSAVPGLRLAALLVVWLLLHVGSGQAASSLLDITDLKQQVAAGSPTTYVDLLQLIFPEKAPGAKEEPQTPPAWSLGDYFKKQPLTAKRGTMIPQALPIKAQGRTLLLLLMDAWGEDPKEEGGAKKQQSKHEFRFNLLALFQTTPTPRLLDLVDIGKWITGGNTDQGFWRSENPLIDLTPTTQACMIYQEHFDSSESSQIHMLWVRNERLEKILTISTYHDDVDPWEPTSRADFRTEPDQGREFPMVVAKLTLKVEPSADRDKGFTRSYRGVWRWDPATQKYGQTSGNLDQLDKFYKEITRKNRHPAPAGSPIRKIKDLKQPVAPDSTVTYADLLQLIFPEKAPGAKEEPQTPPAWSLADYFKKQPLTAMRDKDYLFGGMLALPIKAQGRTLLLFLVAAVGEYPGEGGGDHFDLLALFQTTPTPKLLDLVDLGQMGTTVGMFQGFYKENPLIDLTPTTQACMVYQEHFNSSESFLDIHLLWVRNERLEKILAVSPYGFKGSWEMAATWAFFRTEPDKGREFPKVVAKLTLRVKPAPSRDKECTEPLRDFTRSYRGVWRWNPDKKKYHQVSGDLDKLYKFYEKYH